MVKLFVLFNDSLVIFTLVKAPQMKEIQEAFSDTTMTLADADKLLQLSSEMAFLLDGFFALSELTPVVTAERRFDVTLSDGRKVYNRSNFGY